MGNPQTANNTNDDYFYLKVNGDSMEPIIPDGTLFALMVKSVW